MTRASGMFLSATVQVPGEIKSSTGNSVLWYAEETATVPPWFLPLVPKPTYDSPDAQANRDVAVNTERTFVNANRVDAWSLDHKEKKAMRLEVRCSWLHNHGNKSEEIV